jgi:hypothetical protein
VERLELAAALGGGEEGGMRDVQEEVVDAVVREKYFSIIKSK